MNNYGLKWRNKPGIKEMQARKDAIWHRENADRLRELSKIWWQNNPHMITAYATKRRGVKKQRTPKWLTDDELKQISLFYLLSKETVSSTMLIISYLYRVKTSVAYMFLGTYR